MAFEFTNDTRDADLKATKALPAAGATADSDGIDLGQAVGGRLGDVIVEFSLPALAAHTDAAESVTLTLLDSADDETYAVCNPSVVATVIGVVTDGSAAYQARFRLPLNVRRYIAVRAAVSDVDTGPVLTASSVTISLIT